MVFQIDFLIEMLLDNAIEFHVSLSLLVHIFPSQPGLWL